MINIKSKTGKTIPGFTTI